MLSAMNGDATTWDGLSQLAFASDWEPEAAIDWSRPVQRLERPGGGADSHDETVPGSPGTSEFGHFREVLRLAWAALIACRTAILGLRRALTSG